MQVNLGLYHTPKRKGAENVITLPEIPAGTAKPPGTCTLLLDVIERCYTGSGDRR